MAGAQVTALKTKIQDVADALIGEESTKALLGDPGAVDVSHPISGAVPRGHGWDAGHDIDTICEGTGQWAEEVLIAKLNELITQFNQLLADHNTATAPDSTATTVTTIST